MSPPLKFCPVPQIRLYPIAAAVVAVTYPVCSSLLCLGVKERPGTVQGVQAECGRQTMEAGLLLHVGVGFELHLAKMIPSCVADPSAPASGQGLSFLAGLGLTVRHPPYLKLVISFLFISAAVQVPLARSTPTSVALAVLALRGFRFILSSPAPQRNQEPHEAGAGRRESRLELVGLGRVRAQTPGS